MVITGHYNNPLIQLQSINCLPFPALCTVYTICTYWLQEKNSYTKFIYDGNMRDMETLGPTRSVWITLRCPDFPGHFWRFTVHEFSHYRGYLISRGTHKWALFNMQTHTYTYTHIHTHIYMYTHIQTRTYIHEYKICIYIYNTHV